MERVLGKKQAIKNEEWLKAGKRIEELVPKDELDEKVRVTVEEIGKQLGMKPEEVFRLSDFSKEDFLNMMTKGVTGFSKAEYLTKI